MDGGVRQGDAAVHGVDLTRMLTLDTVDGGKVLVHVAYLAVLAVLGWFWAVRRLTKRMVS